MQQQKKTHVGVVRRWCQSLAILSAVSMTREEAELRLGAFVPLLVDRFPDAAFTKESLEHCAALAVKGFPTYGELTGWLSAWWREHRPIIALPPPSPPQPRPPPTPEEIAHVRDRVAEVTAALRASALYAEQQSRRLDEAVAHRAGPRYLDAATLDRINPLPNGFKRHRINTSDTNLSMTEFDGLIGMHKEGLIDDTEAAAPVDPDPPDGASDDDDQETAA